jgi:hypothetical protein
VALVQLQMEEVLKRVVAVEVLEALEALQAVVMVEMVEMDLTLMLHGLLQQALAQTVDILREVVVALAEQQELED